MCRDRDRDRPARRGSARRCTTTCTIPAPTAHLIRWRKVPSTKPSRRNVRRAFQKNRIANPLYFAGDGIEALELLRARQVPEDRRLILLDLNTPRMNGLEFLRELRNDPQLEAATVVVLTHVRRRPRPGGGV